MMLKQITRWLDPILLIGLFISIAVSVLMVRTGNDTITGLIIGLLSTIVTLLIDAIFRIQKVETSFIDAAGLSRILADESIGKTLREMTYAYETIKKYNFEHYRKLADMTIDECLAKLREIALGSVTVAVRSVQAYEVLGFQEARRDIKEIHATQMSFWTSDFGRKYMELNRAAIKRGVQITRIFALALDEARDSLELLREQEKAGIRVLVVRPDHVDHEFTIFDDRVLIGFEVENNKDYVFESIILDTAQVKRRLEEFRQLADRYGKTIKEVVAIT